jgi:hypothetical protein
MANLTLFPLLDWKVLMKGKSYIMERNTRGREEGVTFQDPVLGQNPRPEVK